MRVEEVRTSSFLIRACPFFFCSPVKRSVEVDIEEDRKKKEREKERHKGRKREKR